MDRYLDILHRYWGYDAFRGIQEEIIRSIGAGRDTLGLMPTGGGKSVTFQVPALAGEGLCLVVTPLIALMKDQVAALRSRGIMAAAVHAGMKREEQIAAFENCIFGDYKFLYVSPERLATELFRVKLRRMKVCLIAVDEAHCISQWGYDFRPAYLNIADIRPLLPDVPVLALTATATPEVAEDIQRRLLFREPNLIRMSFDRPNLSYVVRFTEDKLSELYHILGCIGGTSIVYVRDRSMTKEIAGFLRRNGISAESYHAGMVHAVRDASQQRWQAGEARVMVATNAFGMGIDKPDVRTVIHFGIPDSVEAYFQEAGRAGRDGKKSYAVLLYEQKDMRALARRVSNEFPPQPFIRKVYEELSYYFQLAMGDGEGCTFDFNPAEFCEDFRHPAGQTEGALRLLTLAGYIDYVKDEERPSRLMMRVRRDELYRVGEPGSAVERVLQAVLRLYGGLFSDYVFIEEEAVARLAGVTRAQVYETLSNLRRCHILDYIPHECITAITYTRRREESSRIVLSPSIYEERRTRCARRVRAMRGYVSEQTLCRSRYLLRYFGEEQENDCMRCDLCIGTRSPAMWQESYEDIRRLILQRLSDGKPHFAEEIRTLSVDATRCFRLIREMLRERVLCFRDGGLTLAAPPSGDSTKTSKDKI